MHARDEAPHEFRMQKMFVGGYEIRIIVAVDVDFEFRLKHALNGVMCKEKPLLPSGRGKGKNIKIILI